MKNVIQITWNRIKLNRVVSLQLSILIVSVPVTFIWYNHDKCDSDTIWKRVQPKRLNEKQNLFHEHKTCTQRTCIPCNRNRTQISTTHIQEADMRQAMPTGRKRALFLQTKFDSINKLKMSANRIHIFVMVGCGLTDNSHTLSIRLLLSRPTAAAARIFISEILKNVQQMTRISNEVPRIDIPCNIFYKPALCRR